MSGMEAIMQASWNLVGAAAAQRAWLNMVDPHGLVASSDVSHANILIMWPVSCLPAKNPAKSSSESATPLPPFGVSMLLWLLAVSYPVQEPFKAGTMKACSSSGDCDKGELCKQRIDVVTAG
jgi:hypothetical protein